MSTRQCVRWHGGLEPRSSSSTPSSWLLGPAESSEKVRLGQYYHSHLAHRALLPSCFRVATTKQPTAFPLAPQSVYSKSTTTNKRMGRR